MPAASAPSSRTMSRRRWSPSVTCRRWRPRCEDWARTAPCASGSGRRRGCSSSGSSAGRRRPCSSRRPIVMPLPSSPRAANNTAYLISPHDFYRGRRVLITGGLGFIGSNLARALVDLDADVLLVDSLIPEYGGLLFNIAGIEDRLRVNVADVRQQSTMNHLVRDREVIFNLAGQVSHIDSMRDPDTDL